MTTEKREEAGQSPSSRTEPKQLPKVDDKALHARVEDKGVSWPSPKADRRR